MTAFQMLCVVAAICGVWALICTAALLHDKRAYGVAACPKCGQTDQGQTGEYACSECGLPTVWDAPAGVDAMKRGAAERVMSGIEAGRRAFRAGKPRDGLAGESERIGWDEAAHDSGVGGPDHG